MTRSRIQHALERAASRYGVTLTPETLAGLEARIAAGDCIVARRMPDGSQQVLVRCDGVIMVAVFNPVRCWIVTFLPPGCGTAGKERNRTGQSVQPKEFQLAHRFAKRRRARDGVRRLNP